MNRIAAFFACRPRVAWAAAIALSLLAGLVVALTDISRREEQHLSLLQTEARRTSFEITSSTLNGNIMGSITLLGLIDGDIKQDATNGLLSLDSHIAGTLNAVGGSFDAEGVFIVGEDGIVKTSWDRINKPSTGLDVRFRPYYKMAMKGQTSVYAAVSMARGDRSLYFTAPVFAERAKSHIGTGAVVARTNLDRVDALLKGKFDQALLLSPQGVVFASTTTEWVGMLEGTASAERLKAIRELKQFGPLFEKTDPKPLPLDATARFQLLDGRRFAVGVAPVQWNDPSGDWTLVVMEDLDRSVSKQQSLLAGAATALLGLVLGWMWINLLRGRRVQDEANAQLKAHAQQQEANAAFRARLASTSLHLQRCEALDDLARVFLREAQDLLGVVHGAVYAVPAQGREYLQLIGSSASADPPPPELELGEGLLGQCAKGRQTRMILTPPDGFWTVRSGLGSTQPTALMLAPLVLQDRLIGMVELAVLKVPHDDATSQLEEIAALLTNSMEILRRNLRTKDLLDQAQQQGEAMQVQAQELSEQKTVIEATEAWYRGIIESAPDGMLVTNEQGVITLANLKLEAMFGYAAGELIGKPIENLVPQAIRKRHVGLRDGYAGQGENRAMGNMNRELRGVRKDGSEFAVEVGLSRLPSIAGRGANVCASVRDITERTIAEDRLQQAYVDVEQSKELTQAVLDNSPTDIYIKDLEGRFLLINRKFGDYLKRVLQLDVAQLIGHSIAEFVGEQNDAWGRETDAQVLVRGELMEFEHCIERPTGMEVRQIFKFPLRDGAGKIYSICVIAQDVSEKKQAEQEILLAKQTLEIALTSAKMGSWKFYPAEGRLEADAATIRLYGLEGVEMDGSLAQWFTFVEPQDAKDVGSVMQHTMENRLAEYKTHFRVIKPDHGTVHIMSIGRFTYDDAGQAVLATGLVWDISDIKKSEAQLQERMDELERFHSLTIDREEKMISLKGEINTLLQSAGLAAKYKIVK